MLTSERPVHTPTGPSSSERVYRWLRLLATGIFTLTVFDRWVVYNTPLNGVDGSWAIGIHLARQANLSFGTDFVFTYGPLGWYLTRLPIAVQTWELLLLDAVFLLHAGGVIWLALGNRLSGWRYLLMAGLIALHTVAAGTETPFVFYFFVLAYLGYYQQTGQGSALLGASAMAVLTFYMKANVGLVAIMSVLFYPTAQVITGRMPVWDAGLGVGSLCTLLVVSALVMPVRLWPYLVAQWHIIDSYNDVMYTLQHQRVIGVAIGILLLTVAGFGVVLVEFFRSRKLMGLLRTESVLLLLVALQLFVLFKESFVRADGGHIGFFYKYGLLPFAVPALFSAYRSVRRWAVLPMLLLAAAAPWLVPYNWDARLPYRWAAQAIHYCRDAMTPLRPTLVALTKPTTPLPAPWLRRLHDRRVDVIPWDISLVYQHRLRYAPRPMMQTYQVTDAYLDSLNAAYYGSPRAADYVLVGWDSIDGRDPFADEPLTKVSLRQHYAVVDQQGDWLLLERKSQPSTCRQVERSLSTVASLNKPIPVDTIQGYCQLWQVDCAYTPVARLQRLLFQPPPINLALTYQTGERDTFRTATPLLKAGLIVPAHPRTLAELAAFLRGHDQQVTRVKSVQLLADPTNFNPQIKLRKQPLLFSQ